MRHSASMRQTGERNDCVKHGPILDRGQLTHDLVESSHYTLTPNQGDIET